MRLTDLTLQSPDYLSASSISTFHQCPLKYKYSRIDGLREPQTFATFVGTFVHSVLEEFYKLEPSDRTTGMARQLASSIWSTIQDEAMGVVHNKKDQIRDMRWQAWFCLENIWKLEDPTKVNFDGTETEFNRQIDGVTVKGIIDRWALQEDGKIYIGDYKTGKVPRKQWQGDKFDQLIIYGILTSDEFGKPIGTLDLLYLKDGVRLSYVPSEEDIKRVKKHIVTTRAMIDERCESEVFETKTSVLCGWCHFKTICPAWSK